MQMYLLLPRASVCRIMMPLLLEENKVDIKCNKYVVRYDIFWNTCRQTYLQIYLANYDGNTNLGKYCEMAVRKPLF